MAVTQKDFLSGKTVFVTGSTGFKGTWLCEMLLLAGAKVTGFALAPPTKPSLFDVIHLDKEMNQIEGDVRNYELLQESIAQVRPEIVFHLAAQPLVRESYRNPLLTYQTNVMGTVNLLESIRHLDCVRSVVNVTTDKVYDNQEWAWGYRETDTLNGADPYSNSKSCSELVTSSYIRSFFSGRIAVSTCRAGNVIGGGDFAHERIIPDCFRAVQAGKPVCLRNPHSIRPYQHVLEALSAYLLTAQKQYETPELAGCYNVAPDESGCATTGHLTELFCRYFSDEMKIEYENHENAMHETNFLKLDASLIRQKLGWCPFWNLEDSVKYTAEWYHAYLHGDDVVSLMNQQIREHGENYV